MAPDVAQDGGLLLAAIVICRGEPCGPRVILEMLKFEIEPDGSGPIQDQIARQRLRIPKVRKITVGSRSN